MASPYSGTMTHAHLLLLGLTILCELLFQDLITLAKNALAKFYPNRASIVYQIYGIVQVWCNCVVLYPSTLSDKHPSNCWFSSVYDDDDDFFFSTASPDNGSAVGENAEHVIKVVRSQNKEFVASQDFKFIQKIFSVTRSGQKLTLKPLCIAFILIFWWLVGIVQPAFFHHFAKAYRDVKSLCF